MAAKAVTCFLLSTNLTDRSATFSISGVRWEYFLPTPSHLDSLIYIAKRSDLKALNYAKRYSIRQQKLEDAA